MASGEDPEESFPNSQAESRGLKRHLTHSLAARHTRVPWGKQRPCLGHGGAWKVSGVMFGALGIFYKHSFTHTLYLLLRQRFPKQCAFTVESD